MKYILSALLALPLWGAFEAQVTSVGSTTAILRIRGYSGACLVDLNTYDGLFNLPHPDWPSPTLDSTHSTTTEDGNGTKYIQLGQRRGNLALVAGQAYFVNVSGCGGNKTVFFNTRPARVGAMSARPPGQNLANYHAADTPTINWNYTGTGQWYTDPTTGLEMKIINGPEVSSWAYNADQAWTRWAGATSWTSPSTISNGSTSSAVTSGTNPIYLYANNADPWSITNRSVENIGVQLWGQCIGGAVGTDDCKLVMYLFDTPGTPATDLIEVAVTGTFGAITAGASTYSNTPKNIVSNNTFPSGYPRPMFNGWGGNFQLPSTKRGTSTNMTINTISGTGINISMGSLGVVNNFPLGLDTGDHIWINGSGCSAAGNTDVCTIASVTNGAQATITESLGITGPASAMAHPWGVAIYKKTSTGTIKIGAKWRMSGGQQSSTGTLQATCGPVEITRSDGVKGFPCAIPDRNSYSQVYFISNDGEEVHLITTAHVASIGGPLQGIVFDEEDATVMYGYHSSTNNLYKLKYNGDWGVTPTVWELDPPSGAKYAINQGGDFAYSTWETPYLTPSLKISNVVSKINTYAATLGINLVAPPYKAWNGRFFGASGKLAFYGRVLNLNPPGQDTGPCQIFIFNIDTAEIIDHHDGGTDPNQPGKFAECHSFGADLPVANTYKLSFNLSGNKGTAILTDRLLHGPHRMRINAIMRSGVWDAVDTSVDWPATGTYDRACPSVGVGANQIPQAYADVGANNDNGVGQCMTLRVAGSTAAKVLCNEYGKDPTNGGGDALLYGNCEWDTTTIAPQTPPGVTPTYSGGPPLEPGMKFVDRAVFQKTPGDQENMRVLTVEPAGDGVNMKITVQRNAVREYCCFSGGTTVFPNGNQCGTPTSAGTHLDGWDAFMTPGSFGSCNQSSSYVYYPDPTTDAGKSIIEVPILIGRGHSGVGSGPNNTITLMAPSGNRTLATLADLGIQPPPPLRFANSKFNFESIPIGTTLQQYLGKAQQSAPDNYKYFGSDANSLNPGVGTGGNLWTNGVDTPRAGNLITQVSGRLWRIGLSGTEDVKSKPIIGWCGPQQLTDISSPATGNVIDVAPDFSFCRAYNNNECRTGSTPGMVWATCPRTTKNTATCFGDPCHDITQTGMDYQRAPVVLSIQGGAGYVRTFQDEGVDARGNHSRLVSTFMKPPGTQFPFWSTTIHPSGQLIMAPSGGWADGIRNVYWLARLPKHPRTTSKSKGFEIPIIQYGAKSGVTHRRIKFGNNPQFQCNPNYRDECFTDGVIIPYAFENETPATPTACASGCSVGIPAWPDEPLWYVEQTYNGSVWTDGPVKVMVP